MHETIFNGNDKISFRANRDYLFRNEIAFYSCFIHANQ